jgi:homoserine acetyltransferase
VVAEEFCEQLAARGRYQIRYDNRDTGLSTACEPGKPPYTIDDMADDAIHVLDGHGIAAAHVVGMSLGGMIGQSNLPHASQAYMAHAAEGESVDCPIAPSHRIHGQRQPHARRYRSSA